MGHPAQQRTKVAGGPVGRRGADRCIGHSAPEGVVPLRWSSVVITYEREGRRAARVVRAGGHYK
jgi:hypothetical protein